MWQRVQGDQTSIFYKLTIIDRFKLLLTLLGMTFFGLTQSQVTSINKHSIEYSNQKNLLETMMTIVYNPLFIYFKNQMFF